MRIALALIVLILPKIGLAETSSSTLAETSSSTLAADCWPHLKLAVDQRDHWRDRALELDAYASELEKRQDGLERLALDPEPARPGLFWIGIVVGLVGGGLATGLAVGLTN